MAVFSGKAVTSTCMHLKKITGGWCLHSRRRLTRAHLEITNLLITNLLVLCFSQWFLLFLPPKFLLISCRPIDSYSDICYLGTDKLIIFVSFLWMIWVNLPFLIYLFIHLCTLFAQIAPRENRKTWKRWKSRSSTLPSCRKIRKHCPVQWTL